MSHALDEFASQAAAGDAASSLVAVLGALFPGDAARQQAWVADVTAPGSRGAAPLKARSTFMAADADAPPVPQSPDPTAAVRRRVLLLPMAVALVAATLIALAIR
jgi:hypothetical protein